MPLDLNATANLASFSVSPLELLMLLFLLLLPYSRNIGFCASGDISKVVTGLNDLPLQISSIICLGKEF